MSFSVRYKMDLQKINYRALIGASSKIDAALLKEAVVRRMFDLDNRWNKLADEFAGRGGRFVYMEGIKLSVAMGAMAYVKYVMGLPGVPCSMKVGVMALLFAEFMDYVQMQECLGCVGSRRNACPFFDGEGK